MKRPGLETSRNKDGLLISGSVSLQSQALRGSFLREPIQLRLVVSDGKQTCGPTTQQREALRCDWLDVCAVGHRPTSTLGLDLDHIYTRATMTRRYRHIPSHVLELL